MYQTKILFCEITLLQIFNCFNYLKILLMKIWHIALKYQEGDEQGSLSCTVHEDKRFFVSAVCASDLKLVYNKADL